MKHTLLPAGVLLALTASTASAAGMSLGWNDCAQEVLVVNKNFACNTNAGGHDLYIALDPPPNITATHGHTSFLDLQVDTPSLPAWWELENAGACRATSLTGSGDFSASASRGMGVWIRGRAWVAARS